MQDTTRRTAARALIAGLAANLALVAVVAAAAPGPGWLAVDSFSATARGVNGARLSVTTNGTIPKRPDSFVGDNLIVGFAWIDGDTGKALVATIHPVIGRDSNQRPDAWHLHTVTLTTGTTSSDVCVASIDSTPTAGINIQGSVFSVNLDRSSMPAGIGPDDIDLATGFTVQQDLDCGSHLGVVVRT